MIPNSFPRLRPGQPALILAPMEGVTDAPMRAVQSERGAFAFCVAEFLRVSGHRVPGRVFLRHVPELKHQCRTPSGTPVQIQLLGGNPDRLAESAATAVALGAEAIDLNFGCPAPTVNRHDGGATLLKYPDRIREIVAAVRTAVPQGIPVSAKLRLGWEDTSLLRQNARAAAEGGADWITLHGRTKKAGYAPPIHWEPIGEIRREVEPLPVVANGDIWSVEDFLRCRQITGCEHFMLGRGALVDPNLPRNVAKLLGISLLETVSPFGHTMADWLALFERFSHHTGPRPERSESLARRIKQWASLARRYGTLTWFDEIKSLSTFESIADHLKSRWELSA